MRAHDRPDPTPVTPALLREWRYESAPSGTVLVVGGARQVPGAVLLSGIGALRAGANTLQLAVVERHASALGLAVPEAMVLGLPETESGAVSAEALDVLADVLPDARSVVIGPGLTEVDETAALLERLLPEIGRETSVVLDAFALGAVSAHPELAKPVAGRIVLTPNTTEAAFLLNRPGEPVDDLVGAALEIAERYGAAVNLMGVVAAPDGRTWRDGTGHPGLGTSGSGDVLAGLTGGFLASSPDLAQAACWAGHAHAMAGQRLIPRTGMRGILARELLDEVPGVLVELQL
ncbi:NAD(P)H-hydrate dehydratase [Umezawaea beigongshangensis]|uniref:NAD(P)H-hydrate dehydratase n=1 Tax=Umezawaea beigongshangensis TaxID=2780383 RepID=UPI0018F24D70|nr:NAD(P)H-hydrate dehydratase [Umezawaea beigongshangensis]